MSAALVKISIAVLVGLTTAAVCYWRSRHQYQHHQPQSRDDTPNRRYENNEPVCCVCMENLKSFREHTLPCEHKLHRKCAELLFKNQTIKTCPLCRKLITSDVL